MTDERKRYPQGADNIPCGYVLMHYPDGAFWVDPDPRWETPLTAERLVRLLRRLHLENATHAKNEAERTGGFGVWFDGWGVLADALEAELATEGRER